MYDLAPLSRIIRSLESGVSISGKDRPAHAGEHGVLKVSAVTEGHFIPAENKVVAPSDISRLGISPRAGDILVSRANTTALVGASAYVERDYPNLHLSDKLWKVVIADEQRDAVAWLKHVLNLRAIRTSIAARATGTSSSMKNISQPAFLSIEVPHPSQKEQQKLADVLDTWDRAIHQHSLLLRAKHRLKRGLVQQLLTGKRRFKEFERQSWREYQIGELLEQVSRPVDWDDEESYDLVSIRRRSGGLILRERRYGKQIKTKQLFEIRTGDLLISKMQVVHGALGLVTPAFDGMKASGSYISLVAKDDRVLDVSFFDYLTNLPRMYHAVLLASYGVHIEKMTFNLGLYLRTTVLIPPSIEEQGKIVEVLRNIDREIALLKAELELLKEQKRGLMQKLLTGQVRVKV
jgi:type I restriction enzyme S subunit